MSVSLDDFPKISSFDMVFTTKLIANIICDHEFL